MNTFFFEFVPFDPNNFDAEGNLTPNYKALMIHEVQEGKRLCNIAKHQCRRMALSYWRYHKIYRQRKSRNSYYRKNQTLLKPCGRAPKRRKT